MLYLVNDSFRRRKKTTVTLLGSALAVEEVLDLFLNRMVREKGVFVQR